MFSLITFIITISIVVVFHEYGHYLAARWYGVHVERFSVGFGKVLYQRTDSKGTEWAISMLPLGGYVKPLAEPRHSQKIGESVAEKTSFQRIVIYAAGPLFSFLLGVLIYTGVFMIGEEQPEAIIAKPVVGTVAEKSGLLAGERITAVNGESVDSWPVAVDKIVTSFALGKSVALNVQKNDAEKNVLLNPPVVPQTQLERIDWLKESGLALREEAPIVTRVLPGGAAEAAGLKEGDQVLQFNHKEVTSLSGLISDIQASAQQEVQLLIVRDGAQVSLTMKPAEVVSAEGKKVGRIQAEFRPHYPLRYVQYGLFDSVLKASIKTWDTAWISLKMMGKMLLGEISLDNISGPLTIADYSGRVAQYGLNNFVQFIALISISIGVLNLLPVPGLDGGQMVLNGIEWIMRKPLPASVMETLMKLGYGLLLLLMIFAFHNDLMRIFNG